MNALKLNSAKCPQSLITVVKNCVNALSFFTRLFTHMYLQAHANSSFSSENDCLKFVFCCVVLSLECLYVLKCHSFLLNRPGLRPCVCCDTRISQNSGLLWCKQVFLDRLTPFTAKCHYRQLTVAQRTIITTTHSGATHNNNSNPQWRNTHQ